MAPCLYCTKVFREQVDRSPFGGCLRSDTEVPSPSSSRAAEGCAELSLYLSARTTLVPHFVLWGRIQVVFGGACNRSLECSTMRTDGSLLAAHQWSPSMNSTSKCPNVATRSSQWVSDLTCIRGMEATRAVAVVSASEGASAASVGLTAAAWW